MSDDPTPFDERFAARVRETFDAYEEPVDEAALARMRAALGHPPAARRAPDRPARAGQPARWRRGLGVLAALALAVGVAVWTGRGGPLSEPSPEVAALDTTDAAGPAAFPPEASGADLTAERGTTGSGSLAAAPAPESPASATPPALGSVETPDDRRQPGGMVPPAAAVAARPGVAAAPDVAVPDVAAPPDPSAASTSEPPAVVAIRPAPPTVGGAETGVTPSLSVPSPGPVAAAVPPLLVTRAPDERGGAAVRVVVSASAVAGDDVVESAGVAAGLAREWPVGRGLSVSGGAIAALTRTVIESDESAVGLAEAGANPGQAVDVTAESTLRTVAVEIPLDLGLDLVETPGGRLGVSVGVTSVLYLAQTFDDEGQTFSGETVVGSSGEPIVVLSSEPFASRETVGPLGRLDLGRQLNLGLQLTPRGGALPISAEVYGRIPLGGLTSRDLPLSTVGFRLRYTLR